MAQGFQKRVNQGVAWIGLASSLVSILDFVALVIVMGFWVSEEDYGIASLAVTLFPVLDLATDMGLLSAIIYGDDPSERKISTVFWMNVVMSFVLCALLYVVGPLVGRLQGHPIVGTLLIAYGGKLVFQNFYSVPGALLRRELRFKEISIIRVIANSVEFVVKIGFAAAGFTIWCFVLGPLARVLVVGIGTQICHPWRPRLVFRFREGAEFLRYGLKTSTSQILFHTYSNLDYQVVGAFFGAAAVGLYKIAYELVLEPVRVISQVIVDIAFPTFSRLRGQTRALIEQFVAFSRQNLVVVLPFVALILLEAGDLLYLWKPGLAAAAAPARILCFVGVLRALSFLVPPLLDGTGFPGRTLRYSAVAAVVLPTLFVLFAWTLGGRIGYLSVALAWAVGYPIAFAVLAVMALRVLGLSSWEYLRRIGGIPLWTLVAVVGGFLVRALTYALDLPPLARFGAVAVVTLSILAVLLFRFEGISPRSIRESMT